MTTANDQKLSEYDFIVCIDASGSMSEPHGKSTRWEYAQETLVAITRQLDKYDSDGIDVVIFGGKNIQTFQGVTADKVKEVFSTRSPMGSTPLAEALAAGVKLAGKSDKKDFVLVMTDGIPDDARAAETVIRNASQTLEKDEDLTFLFVQIGNDASATAYLKRLDDDLKGAKFDIVDAKTVDEVEAYSDLSQLLIDAIND